MLILILKTSKTVKYLVCDSYFFSFKTMSPPLCSQIIVIST